MTTWDNLLTAALLGTERRTPQITEDAPAPLRQLPTKDAEHLLLSAAGMMTIYRRAGYTPQVDPRALSEAAPEETLPPCSIRAVNTLLRLLMSYGANRLLIGEWLFIVGRKNKRIPHVFLSELMQRLTHDVPLRAMFVSVVGERGRWLAAQNSEWEKYLQIAPDAPPTWIQALFSHAVPSEEVARTEADALQSINSEPLQNQLVFKPLSKCRHVWSEALVEAYIARIIAVHEKKLLLNLDPETNGLFAVSVPRGSIDIILHRLKVAAGDEKKYVFFRPLLDMLDLRRDMLQDLSHE